MSDRSDELKRITREYLGSGDPVNRARLEGDFAGHVYPLVRSFVRRNMYGHNQPNGVVYDNTADLTQDCMEIVIRQLREGKLRNPDSVASWIYVISNRRVASEFRKFAIRREMLQSLPAGHWARPDMHADPEYEAIRNMAIEEGMGRLNPGQRRILDLLYFQDLDPAEIAKLMGITENNAYVRAHRARAALRAAITA
ncbi:MAG: sigma-70 family RNA polymerase sigma factor [Candidatus Aenigmarchaeota archaeon]|nr:sigma-70 family RNA polymerase sigma factor [Candidatus Aenigmarchaeota archaeon]